MTNISLLRHGEIEGGPRFWGSTDVLLTAKGYEQMRQATQAPFTCAQLISSPLKRCADFASDHAANHDLPLLIEPRLSEMHFGDWEGCTTSKLYERDPTRLEQFWSDPDKYPPPNGERLSRFEARVALAWSQIIENCRGKDTLIVTHGGVIRVLLCRLKKIPLTKLMDIEVGYGARFDTICSTDGTQKLA